MRVLWSVRTPTTGSPPPVGAPTDRKLYCHISIPWSVSSPTGTYTAIFLSPSRCPHRPEPILPYFSRLVAALPDRNPSSAISLPPGRCPPRPEPILPYFSPLVGVLTDRNLYCYISLPRSVSSPTGT